VVLPISQSSRSLIYTILWQVYVSTECWPWSTGAIVGLPFNLIRVVIGKECSLSKGINGVDAITALERETLSLSWQLHQFGTIPMMLKGLLEEIPPFGTFHLHLLPENREMLDADPCH
jgi:hypothetical protein